MVHMVAEAAMKASARERVEESAMPYSVKSVANAILNKAAANGERLTPLKLQKLLYYVCGYYVAAYNEPLIDHTFEAWEYGPVVPALYREFREYGNQPITGLATEFDWDAETSVPVPPPDGDRRFESVLDFVWKKYGNYTAAQLSAMTHAPGSPWAITRQQNPGIKDADISSEVLISHFGRLIKRKAA